MAGIMQHAGYLDDNEKITIPAIKAFLNHRNAIIRGNIDTLFQEETSEPQDIIILNLEDKERFPNFFEKWTNKLEIVLKMLNMQSNIQVPFFDTLALGSSLDLKSPDLSFESLMGILAASASAGPPTSFQIPLLTLNIEINKIPNIIEKIQSDIIKIPQLPIPIKFFPSAPSPSFPDLEYTVPIFNLKDKQISILSQIPSMLSGVMGELMKIENLSKFATEGPISLLKTSYEVVKNEMPKPPGTSNKNYDVNVEALSRTVAKPIAITAVGVTVGSASNGITGNMGAQEPDPMKNVEQPPSKCKETILNGYVTEIRSLFMRTNPEFRRALVNMCNRLEVNPDWMVACMTLESAGTFSPDVRSGEAGEYDENLKKPKSKKDQYTQNELIYIQSKIPDLRQQGWKYSAYEQFATEVLNSSKTYGQGTIRQFGGKTILARIEPHYDNHPKLNEELKKKGIKRGTKEANDLSATIPPYWHRGASTYERVENDAKVDLSAIYPIGKAPANSSEESGNSPPNIVVQTKLKYYKGNSGPAVGLIQFTTAPLNGQYGLNKQFGYGQKEYKVTRPDGSEFTQKGLTLEVLSSMTQIEQLEIVEAYFNNAFRGVGIKSGKSIKSILGLYSLIFLPGLYSQINSSNDDVVSRNRAFCESNIGYVKKEYIVTGPDNGKKKIIESDGSWKGRYAVTDGAYISKERIGSGIQGVYNKSVREGGRVCVDEQKRINSELRS